MVLDMPSRLWSTLVEFAPTEQRQVDFGDAVGAFARVYHRHPPAERLVGFLRAALKDVALIVLDVLETTAVDPASLPSRDVWLVDRFGHHIGTWHTYLAIPRRSERAAERQPT